jgi:hypothetical protein
MDKEKEKRERNRDRVAAWTRHEGIENKVKGIWTEATEF